MNKKVRYRQYWERDPDSEEFYEIDVPKYYDLDDCIQGCLEDFCTNHDGWELYKSFPLKFEFGFEGEETKIFLVELDWSPNFYGYEA